MGRFLTPDLYAPSAKPDNPQSWNRYTYVTNDPINANDPSGRDPLPVNPYQGLIDLAIGRDRIDQELLIQLSDRFARKALNNFQEFVLRQNFKAFLDEMSNDCKRELAPYVSGLRKGVDSVALYDVTYHGNSSLFAKTSAHQFIGLRNVEELGGDRFTDVGGLLDLANKDAYTAVGNVPRPGVYFRGFDKFAGDGMYLFLHEISHTQIIGDNRITDLDERLASELRINRKENKTWSDAVSDFFNSQCKDKGPQP
jgi:hypothetical protein